MKINEIFASIQGEGANTGTPMVFVRLSGCNLNCDFCDTKYHKKVNLELTVDELEKEVKKYGVDIICFTGGEPLLQADEIRSFSEKYTSYKIYLETNGTLLKENKYFDYIACSPKKGTSVKRIDQVNEIKIVCDGEDFSQVEKNWDRSKLYIMPMTGKGVKDYETMKKVWDYCVENNIKFSSRLQYLIFNNRKGV